MLKGMRATDAGSDSKNIYFRSDRISTINGRFYFATREGTLEGPYRTREEALWAIDAYINRMTRKIKGVATSSSRLSFSLGLSKR